MNSLSELPTSIEWIILYVFGFVAVVVSIVAIVDVLKSRFKRPYDKAIWIVLILCFNLFGAILYFALSRGRKIPGSK